MIVVSSLEHTLNRTKVGVPLRSPCGLVQGVCKPVPTCMIASIVAARNYDKKKKQRQISEILFDFYVAAISAKWCKLYSYFGQWLAVDIHCTKRERKEPTRVPAAFCKSAWHFDTSWQDRRTAQFAWWLPWSLVDCLVMVRNRISSVKFILHTQEEFSRTIGTTKSGIDGKNVHIFEERNFWLSSLSSFFFFHFNTKKIAMTATATATTAPTVPPMITNRKVNQWIETAWK